MIPSVRALALVLVALTLGGCGEGEPFDSAAWKAERGRRCEEQSERKKMIGDLLENHLPRGMGSDAVRALLGSPDDFSTGSHWSYFAGDDGLDCITVAVGFRDGRLIEARRGQT